MAKLSEDEQKLLDELTAKQKAPEPENGGTRVNADVYIDLSDENAVKRALSFGLLKAPDLEDEDEDDDDEDGDGKKPKKKPAAPAPRRRGYFPPGEGEEE